jgi:hypothetical protein
MMDIRTRISEIMAIAESNNSVETDDNGLPELIGDLRITRSSIRRGYSDLSKTMPCCQAEQRPLG